MTYRVLAIALVAVLSIISAGCGAADSEESAAVRATITDSITSQQSFVTLADPRIGTPIRLEFDHVHDGVAVTSGGRHVACVDFRSADGTVYDVDYYVTRENGRYRVADVVMHKAGGEDVLPASHRAHLDAAR